MSNPSLGYYWVLTDNIENSLRDNYCPSFVCLEVFSRFLSPHYLRA